MEPNNNKDERFVPTDVPTYHKWSCFQYENTCKTLCCCMPVVKKRKGVM